MRTRNIRNKCSLAANPLPIQTTRGIGNSKATMAVTANSLDVQPPHFRYQPKMKVRLTIQAVNRVTLIQSIRSGSGLGGRSGFTKRSTRGTARRASGTFTQNTQRHESASLIRAVSSGVVGRVA